MNLLITGAWKEAKNHIHQLEEDGHYVKFLQFEKDELPCTYEWVEGVICNGLFLSHRIEYFVNLKYIQLTSVGFDRVPMKYIGEHRIEIHNARGVFSVPMAEFALTGVLQIYKQSRYFYNNSRRKVWEKHRGLIELAEKKVCIVGCGSVGNECAKRFRAFGCDVTGIDIDTDLRTNENYNRMLDLESLEEVLPVCDNLVLTLPLTNETNHLMNAQRLNLMKQGAVLVNLSRGAIIDTGALIQVMPRLGGAVLDVFEEEPLGTDSPLWDMEQVIITPHNSFVGDGNDKRLAEVIFHNLMIRGESDK